MLDFDVMKSVVMIALMCLNSVCYSKVEDAPVNLSSSIVYQNPAGSFLFNPIEVPCRLALKNCLSVYSRFLKPYLAGKSVYAASRLIIPVRRSNLSLLLKYDGFSLYNEKLIGLSYCFYLNKDLSVGAQVDFISLSIRDLGRKSIFTAELFLSYSINDHLSIAWRISNPLEWKLTEEGEIYPVLLDLGIEYTLSSRVKSIVEFRKDLEAPMQFNQGIYYMFNSIGFHIGYVINPNQFYWGFGFVKHHFSLETNIKLHRQLGFAPMLAFSYFIDRGK